MSEFDAEAVSAVEAPPAEYGVDTIQQSRPIDEDERRRLRGDYGWIRTYFKLRPNDYRSVQRSLNQARIGATYDEYLADSLRYAMVAGVFGALLGLFVTYQLSVVGVFEGLSNPLAGAPGNLVHFVAANKTLFGGGVITLVLGTLFGVGTWVGRYYYPVTVVSARRQNIDIVLPHAIVYMYALSHGGMSLVETMRSLADAEDVYGEVAKEFEMIVTDIDLFGSDVYTALQNARNLTPSENLEQFLDDLIGVLDSGADATTFLETESETYLREAEEEQEDFLETLSLMAEVFVVGFVAAPLFLIVTLVVISLIGGNTISQITMLVYVVIPLAMVAFLVLIDVLSQPFEQVSSVPDAGGYDRPAAPASADDADPDERVLAYTQRKRLLRLKALLLKPMTPIERRPLLSLLGTVPLALLTVGALLALGAVEVSLDAMLVRPIATTTGLFVLPFLVIGVPLSLFHELKRRRENEVARRFPDTLNILSSANKMGTPLTDALALVSRWSDGVVAEEIETVRNDITWNHDVTAALLAFGSRLHVPQLARTMKLLADGIRSSGDLSRVLAIAAEDTRNRAKMDRKRRRELSSYVAVVVIGFLVYLLVVVMLASSYLGPVSEVGAGAPSDIDNPVSFVDVPVNVYRGVFFHSALIMGVGSGLLAGKLAENDSLSGLKYGIGFVAVTLVAFLVISMTSDTSHRTTTDNACEMHAADGSPIERLDIFGDTLGRMNFPPDTRGVSEVLGAIMVFALVLTVLVIVQVAGVPAANQQIEFEHNARVQGDFQEFDRSVDQMAATGVGESATIESGVRYPPRLFLINPGPAAGTVSTGEVHDVTFGNVEALNDETADYFSGSVSYIPGTTSLSYGPAYNQYTSAPTTVYEHGILYNTDGSGTSVFDRGNVVSGNRISLTFIEGDLSSSSTRSVAVPMSAASAPSQTVSITGDGNGDIEITIYTELSQDVWENHILATEPHVTGVTCTNPVAATDPCNGLLTISLDPGQTYDLRMAEIGVGSGSTIEDPAYLTKIGPASPALQPGGTDLTVELRDRFHTAKSGQTVSFEITDGNASFVGPSTVETDESGRASVTVNPSGNAEISVKAFYDPDGDGSLEPAHDTPESAFVVEYTGLPVADNANEPTGDLKDINSMRHDVVLESVSFVDKDSGGSEVGYDGVTATFDNTGSSTWTFTEARISFVLATDDPSEADVTRTQPAPEQSVGTLPVLGDFVDINDVTFDPSDPSTTLEFDFDAALEKGGSPFDGLVVVTFEARTDAGESMYLTYFLTD